jgi:hypothetical protein
VTVFLLISATGIPTYLKKLSKPVAQISARIISVCLLRTSFSQLTYANTRNTTACVSRTHFFSFFYPTPWFVIYFTFFVSDLSLILNTSFFSSLLLSLLPVYRFSCVHFFFIDFLTLLFLYLCPPLFPSLI